PGRHRHTAGPAAWRCRQRFRFRFRRCRPPTRPRAFLMKIASPLPHAAHLLAGAGLALALAGCGMKGPLRLPDPPPANAALAAPPTLAPAPAPDTRPDSPPSPS